MIKIVVAYVGCIGHSLGMKTTNNPDFIQVGTAYFARSASLVTETLFKPREGRTASGWYKRTKTGVLFYRGKNKPFAFLVINEHGERFFVNCVSLEGKIRYQYATDSITDSLLGIGDLSYKGKSDVANEVASLFV